MRYLLAWQELVLALMILGARGSFTCRSDSDSRSELPCRRLPAHDEYVAVLSCGGKHVLNSTDFVIFLNGSYGVGKTSTLDHVGDLLAEALMPFSLMDVDCFHRSWPPGDDDPTNVITEAANIALVWRNYKSTGPRQLVVSGVIASRRITSGTKPPSNCASDRFASLPRSGKLSAGSVAATLRSNVQVSSGISTATASSTQDWPRRIWTRPSSKHQDAGPAMWRQTCWSIFRSLWSGTGCPP